jgi:peptide/nickel transport system substrate-binding protein
MNRKLALAVAITFALLSSMIVAAFASPPPIVQPMRFVQETIQGASPLTVDYSIAYDTASDEIIMNMMDTLVVFDGEHTDRYLPSVATSWTAEALGPGGTGIDSGLPIAGLVFENPDNQTGANATYYYRYTFEIRQGVFFQPPYNYSLTPEDVAFSFQRTMLMDPTAGPQWMIQEPLLDIGVDSLEVTDAGQGGDLTNPTQVAEIGALIHGAVQYNSTHVWFNLMFPSAYAPFMQILTQTWSCIMSKQWINNIAIGVYGRFTWPGTWPDYTSWLAYRNPDPDHYPLDNPDPILYGSGPWILETLDYTNYFWTIIRNEMYYAGWPADFPLLSNSKPAGFVDKVTTTWAYEWSVRKIDFLSGDCDFCAVPRQNLAEMYKGGPPYDPNVPGGYYTQDGIRCIQPLPTLAVDAFFFTFDINTGTSYGPIGPANQFNESAIPTDFFGNPTWGINVRKAFAYAFDYDTFLHIAYVDEASHPATAIIPGLSYYDPTVQGYTYNLTKAKEYFNKCVDQYGSPLNTTGFTMTLLYNTGNLGRQTACGLLKNATEALYSPNKFHITVQEVPWSTYLRAAIYQQLPMYSIGWLADFPDPHNFALPFYHTGGAFSTWQAYSNATLDAKIDQGILTPDGPARAAIYHDVQVLAVADVPSFTLDQAVGRHFERDWVVGWYYNPVYPGGYYYNLWKWYYPAEAQLSSPGNPPTTTTALAGWNLPVDVNYDGKVDMRDIGIVAKAFATAYGPPISSRWVYRADINNDRKVDMKDIGLVAKQFSPKQYHVWPTKLSNITSTAGGNGPYINITVAAGTTVTFTEHLYDINVTETLVNVDWQLSTWPGPLLEVQSGLSLTYTYTFIAPGTYYVYNDIVFTLHTINGDYTTSICEVAEVHVT